MVVLNFYKTDVSQITSNNRKADWIVSVDFLYGRTKDIVCKGGEMAAFWHNNKWYTSEYDLMVKLDSDISKIVEDTKAKYPESKVVGQYMSSNKSKVMKEFKDYTKLSPQSDVRFNRYILFSDDKMKKTDYATTQLSYTPTPGPTEAFDELVSLLYEQEELDKILWFIGALLTNNMRNIQKFLYLYGGKGTGKGTILKVIKMLLEEYWAPIDLTNLTSDGDFATSEVKEVPLLIDDDTDLSNIKKDTNLLKLTAHEPLVINSKYKLMYNTKFEGLLIAASNQRFKVRNVDSGITRRAVVAVPTNKTHKLKNYMNLMSRVKYEIPMVAQKAIDLFIVRGIEYYEDYVDYDMIEATDYFYGFVREHALGLGDPCTLKKAAEFYKLYLEEMGYSISGYKRKVKAELQRYYTTFYDSRKVDGVLLRNVFEGFKWDLVFPDKSAYKDIQQAVTEEELLKNHNIVKQESMFDKIAQTYPAQLTNTEGNPISKWYNVSTTLSDIDTRELHFVRVPQNHIVIDFDLKVDGEKDLGRNLKAIESFPKTYTELSKSGKGIHLHYIYDEDETLLDDHISEDIEVKVFKGKSSLRRMLTKCNDLEITHISSGLPIKEKSIEVYKDIEILQLNEQKMRSMIKGNLEKKYHKNTAPSIDFIVKIFDDAQKAQIQYDLRDMRQDILAFAMSSSNQTAKCIQAVSKIKFTTIETTDTPQFQTNSAILPKEELYLYDVEVFPNLFVVVYKKYGSNNKKITLINPTSSQIEEMCSHPLVGFNNRRYDNHIVYAGLLGEDNLSLYRQSQRIINRKDGGSGMYSGAYELSYTDIYDYCSANNKMSLKKWEIKLGILHDEFELPWDQPVPEHLWGRVAEYCGNDVDATEAVLDATSADYSAREILSALSGLSMNATTNQHSTEIIFEGNKNTQDDLVYTDLSEMFPGYSYSFGKSEYRGEDPKEGGYVYVEEGIYTDVALEDVESMHPWSAIAMNAFGKYTKNFKELVLARVAIKHGDFAKARKMFGGKLEPYLKDETQAKNLSNALKTVINSAYGLTSAKFDNPFRHPKNVDNIIAKRGALFMIDLKHAVQELGYTVAHIKTDSIKIPNADQKIIDFVSEFGKKYGYKFEHEATYSKLAIINKSTYACVDKEGKWEATGTQFINPYVFKRLFSKEKIIKEDMFVPKEVKDAGIFLDEVYVGKFAELYASKTGHNAYRVADEKKGFLSGTKGHLWKISTQYTDKEDVDMSYYEDLVTKAIDAIALVGEPNDILPEIEDAIQE